MNGLELSRELLLLTNKKRYLSRAAKVFLDSILGFRQDLEASRGSR